ncbi:tetratricopeptide repeat protein [Pontiella sp. NLcol2]|uniref:Tetratricopeptide repeat protein n=1 Tax=Pontiella agarivorans TaxID=3038953 RepID=A0ABU5N027_9BACT|nr:tetratricopeptide repeat protein [Pontiella agarivorans]
MAGVLVTADAQQELRQKGRGMTRSELARLNPQSESTSVLLESVKALLKNEQLEEALPFLKEILVRLDGDDEKKARQTLAFTLYQLAYCQMQLGEYVSGARNFVRFADAFPDDLQQESARVMAAQCLTMVQQWPAVEEQAMLVLQNLRLTEELKIPAVQLLAEARYQQEKWAEAIKPLTSLYRMAQKDTVRSGAAVMLVTCYVRLDDFPNLFHFLPHCDRVSRHDVGLNLALLEAGDSHYNNGEFRKALLLYRLVLTKAELTAHYEERLRDTKAAMKPFVADGKQTLTEYKERQLKRQQLFDRLKAQYDVIVDFQDYDMDVMLRMAQCYNDLGRNWPAHAIYHRIFDENPEGELADQARYSAFTVMIDEREWAMATVEGYAYVEQMPNGEFRDDVTLNLMQVRMTRQQFELAYEMGQKALELSPDHKYIDQITYLMGYIRFHSLDYQEALQHFTRVLGEWPESRYYESSEYWRAMTLLFLGEFEKAESAFAGYLSNPKYEGRLYEEDASYRLGIAQYGADKFIESEETFRSFVDRYPESTLLSEAYAMLGDLRAAESDLDVALDYYALAREKAQNIGQVNYPLFQAAKVLEMERRYVDIVEMMSDYLGQYGSEGDFANAANWKGKAYKGMDQYSRALEGYFEVVNAYGNDASLSGVDVILNEIVSDYRNPELAKNQTMIMEALDEHLHTVSGKAERTLVLRYQTVFAEIAEGGEREAFVEAVVQAKNIPAAGSGTLLLIAREAVKLKDWALVHEAAERFLANFPVSNQMLYVMIADLDALIGEGRYTEAAERSEEILLKFGYSKSVGYARKRRGDAFRLSGDFERALEAYAEVLSIREWRGALTPEALYWSGICKMELGATDEAFAYFQRIYVLYEGYADWVAPAYLKSIQCMEALGGYEQEIVNTLREMLANERVAATPEGSDAAERLEALQAGEVVP